VTSENQSEEYKQGALEIVERAEEKGLEFLTVRISFNLSDEDAPIVAMARSFTDWNLRNVVRFPLKIRSNAQYCPACGRRTSTFPFELLILISFCVGWVEEDLSPIRSCGRSRFEENSLHLIEGDSQFLVPQNWY
jgi:hypothetical protein